MSPPPHTTNVASRKSGKMEVCRSFQHSGTFTVVDLLTCWSVLTRPQNSATWAGAPEDALPAHLHLTCYCGNHAPSHHAVSLLSFSPDPHHQAPPGPERHQGDPGLHGVWRGP